jgi:hypothetical protein
LVVEPWMIGASRYSPSWCNWSMYAPITSTWSSGCRSTSALTTGSLVRAVAAIR